MPIRQNPGDHPSHPTAPVPTGWRSARRVVGALAVGALSLGLPNGPGPAHAQGLDAATTTSTAPSIPSTTVGTGPSTTTASAPSTTTPNQAVRRWTLTFGGDTLLTRPIAAGTNPFASIAPPLARSDLAIVNLETAVSTRGRAQIKTFTFRSPPRLADLLADAGVDVVSLANNHSLDFGIDALRDTLANLDRTKVAHVGAGLSLAEALAPVEFTIKGTSVAVIGASQIIPNGSWPATSSRPGIASAGKHAINRETQMLLTAVRSAATTNQVVIVVLHWGIEGDPCPSTVQRELGRLLRNAGATAVLGAHPHVLQPIVRSRGADGSDGVVAYSLGNFIWDPRSGATADTGTIELRFDGPTLAGMAFHPHRLNASGWASAVDATSARGRQITSRVAKACPGAAGVAGW